MDGIFCMNLCGHYYKMLMGIHLRILRDKKKEKDAETWIKKEKEKHLLC